MPVASGTHWLSTSVDCSALVAGGTLRIWMFRHFFETNGDTQIYGGIAKNLLLHGRYALTFGTGEAFPTLIRLPGYPFFLASLFQALRDGELRRRGLACRS